MTQIDILNAEIVESIVPNLSDKEYPKKYMNNITRLEIAILEMYFLLNTKNLNTPAIEISIADIKKSIIGIPVVAKNLVRIGYSELKRNFMCLNQSMSKFSLGI